MDDRRGVAGRYNRYNRVPTFWWVDRCAAGDHADRVPESARDEPGLASNRRADSRLGFVFLCTVGDWGADVGIMVGVGVCEVVLVSRFEESHTNAHTLQTLVSPMCHQGRLVVQCVEENGDGALVFEQSQCTHGLQSSKLGAVFHYV